MNETRKKLINVKKATGWSWERMCREIHKVKGNEGASHTTLFRYASGRVKRPNKMTERWIDEGLTLVALGIVDGKIIV